MSRVEISCGIIPEETLMREESKVCIDCGELFYKLNKGRGVLWSKRERCNRCRKLRYERTWSRNTNYYVEYFRSHRSRISELQHNYYVKRTEEYRKRSRELQNRDREVLSNTYIKKIISLSHGNISLKDISPELVNIWRETLLVKRAVRKVKEALDERSI